MISSQTRCMVPLFRQVEEHKIIENWCMAESFAITDFNLDFYFIIALEKKFVLNCLR